MKICLSKWKAEKDGVLDGSLRGIASSGEAEIIMSHSTIRETKD